jgi:hypothetical protein
MRYLTLSWDDGIRESSIKTAAIYEKFGLRAEFNVVATNALAATSSPSGDFGLWNELQARGHVVQPHGLNHTNKAAVPFAEAKDLILKCLDIFSEKFDGFDAKLAIFNFPYNATTPQVEQWLPEVVRAFRTGGPVINPLPKPNTVKLTNGGWADAEEQLDRCFAEFLPLAEGWMIYNTHGLDGEGWGPLRSDYLERFLEKVMRQKDVKILPARDVLGIARFDGAAAD